MATTPADLTLYPFSTRDADSIPLDIVNPVSMMFKDFLDTGALASLTIPTGYDLAIVFATSACALLFLGAPAVAGPNLVQDTPYANTLYIPAQTLLTVKLTPGAAKVLTVDAKPGRLFVQAIRKWNALALPQQAKLK